jgi:hypothetical protein
MAVKTSVNVAGTFQPAKNIYVNVAGTWQKTQAVYANVAGTWQRVHTPVVEITIASSVNDYNIAAAVATALGYTPTLPVDVRVTVNSGVVVGQSYTFSGTNQNRIQTKSSLAGMQTGTLPTGSLLTLTNNGYIVGCGGQGGSFGTPNATGLDTRWAGGTALYATYAITVYNNGTIGGGGGGGAGGDGGGGNSTGGGGGAGATVGLGGYGYGGQYDPYGTTPTLTVGGIGTHNGNNGGDLGLPGYHTPGFDGTGLVGNAGAYIVGNSLVTWATTGTRLGVVVA